MRLGVIPFPASPRQADLVVISGTVTDKIVPGHPAPLRADARPEVRDLDGLAAPTAAARTGTATRSPRASTRSSRSTCTCPAARRGPRRCSRASCCCRSASRTRTWPPAGRVSRTARSRSSLADDAATTEADAPEVATDDRREALLADLRRAPGRRRRSTSVIKPGHGLWVRVATDGLGGGGRGRAAARPSCHVLRLPVGHRLAAVALRPLQGRRRRRPRPAADARAQPSAVPGYAGGDVPLPGAGAGGQDRHRPRASSSRPTCPTTTRASAPGSAATPAPTGTSARPRRCSASPSTGNPDLRHIYLPTEFEGHPLRKDFPLLARVVKPWPGIVDVEPMPGGRRRGRSRRAAKGPTHDASPNASSSATSTRRPPTAASTSSSRPTTA